MRLSPLLAKISLGVPALEIKFLFSFSSDQTKLRLHDRAYGGRGKSGEF